MIEDLTGMAILELRTNAGVAAIVGEKVRPEWADGEGPPGVLIRQLGITYSRGPGTRRLGLQAPMLAALCYGVTRPQAAQLANAVVEAVNARGPRTDASGRLVFGSLVEGGGDVVLDPDTRWPFATVTFELVGAQVVVA